MNKSLRIAPILTGVPLIILTTARALRVWSNDSHLDHVAGAWVALAMDLKDGIFYRPPYSPIGYGGTRYFPLYFCLHAAGIRLFGTWRGTGYALSFASIALLLAGVYFFVRSQAGDCWLAGAAVLAVLAASSTQDSLLTMREDGMAAMFNLWGVVAAMSGQLSRRRLYASAMLFALAFATKESSVFGAAAVLLWLISSQQKQAGWRLFGLMAIAFLLLLVAMDLGSHGRILQLLRLTITSGVSFQSLLKSPSTLLDVMEGYWMEIILFVLAASTLGSSERRPAVRLPFLLYLCTLFITLVIFSSQGTAGNHLLDLHVAAVLLFVSWASKTKSRDFAIAVIAAACLVAWIRLLPIYNNIDSVPLRAQYQQIVRTIGRADKPILADNPLIPLVAGQNPYVMDAFMFRVMREKDPCIADPLWQMLRDQRFAAVVLMDNPQDEEGQQTYVNYHFGAGFVEAVLQDYELAGTPGDEYLYLPRPIRRP